MWTWLERNWRAVCYAMVGMFALYCLVRVLDILSSPEDYPDPGFQLWAYLLAPAFFVFVVWAADEPKE